MSLKIFFITSSKGAFRNEESSNGYSSGGYKLEKPKPVEDMNILEDFS